MYHRVLLKISGEALSSDQSIISRETVLSTVEKIKAVRSKGVQIGIVVGGGNIMRGRSAEGMERNRADHMGMLATAINSLALQDALEQAGVPCVVQSAVEMDRFCDSFSARSAKQALNDGKVVVFACGSGSPFFSTDTAAALRAAEIGADALLLAKNIDAIYSADPKLDPNAEFLAELSYIDVLNRGLKVMDSTAISLCMDNDLPICVFDLMGANLHSILQGDRVGTLVS